jgi:hypothetical protein
MKELFDKLCKQYSNDHIYDMYIYYTFNENIYKVTVIYRIYSFKFEISIRKRKRLNLRKVKNMDEELYFHITEPYILNTPIERNIWSFISEFLGQSVQATNDYYDSGPIYGCEGTFNDPKEEYKKIYIDKNRLNDVFRNVESLMKSNKYEQTSELLYNLFMPSSRTLIFPLEILDEKWKYLIETIVELAHNETIGVSKFAIITIDHLLSSNIISIKDISSLKFLTNILCNDNSIPLDEVSIYFSILRISTMIGT